MSSSEPSDVDEKLSEYRALALDRRQRRFRSNVAAVALGIDLVTLVLVVAHAHGPARPLVGLAFCVIVPGWALIGPLRLHDAALEAGLAVAVGLASLLVIAQLAITLGAWTLSAVDVAVCVACLPSLVWQVRERRQFQARP